MPATSVDTSALVKLVRVEDETTTLNQQYTAGQTLTASELVRREPRRAIRREAPHLEGKEGKADELLDGLVLLPITPSLLDQAGRLEPALLRLLDAHRHRLDGRAGRVTPPLRRCATPVHR